MLELQRGRAHWSAESPSARCKTRICPPGFNGAALTGARRARGAERRCGGLAASTGPRSLERGESAPDRPRQLRSDLASTGPRSLERGEPTPLRLLSVTLGASTGPRSLERGERALPIGFSAMSGLQRGRAHWSAERISQRRRRNRDLSFNGAALTGARRDCRKVGARDMGCASTGPRSLERGENWRREIVTRDHIASTGPRSLERGEPAQEVTQ